MCDASTELEESTANLIAQGDLSLVVVLRLAAATEDASARGRLVVVVLVVGVVMAATERHFEDCVGVCLLGLGSKKELMVGCVDDGTDRVSCDEDGVYIHVKREHIRTKTERTD